MTGGHIRMDEHIRKRAQRAIEEKVFPGCVIGIVRTGEQKIIPVGTIDGKILAQENTIYDLASISKSIPLASLALLFAASNPPRFNLGGKVVDYLPELHNDQDATIEDLLRYRVMGPRLSQLQFKTFEEIRTYVFEHGFDGPSGYGAYANLPAFVLGLVVERVAGEMLPALAHKYFFEPLKMNGTTFFPLPPASFATPIQPMRSHKLDGSVNRVAPTEIVGDREIRGIVHDESARVFALARRAVGHAGLFSTAPDLLKFLEAILQGKLPAVVEGAQKGLGWEVYPTTGGASREWMGEKRSPQTFGKTGFTGTSILCDVGKGIGLVILSNRTYPHRPPDNSAINAFRKDIADIVFG